MNDQQTELLRKLRQANDETIYNVEDTDFRPYGKVISLPGTDEMIAWADTVLEPDGPVYVPHYPDSESRPWKKILEDQLAGGMPLEIGSCCGSNVNMNGMEYHKGHEYILALTPLVLFLGFSGDIEDGDHGPIWESSLGKFFFVPRGAAVELYSTTLHLAPCRCGIDDFRSLIILPDETNLDLEQEPLAGSLLFKKNKWMICHPDSPAAANGVWAGIKGQNRALRPLEERV